MCTQGIPGRGSQNIRGKLHLFTNTVTQVSDFSEEAVKCLVSTLKCTSCQVASNDNSSGISAEKCHGVVGHSSLPIVGPGCIVFG